jgi:UDP-N-acetylmuramoyl-L-alanyl-D-glutamate--2,6-diaminopimelate ligase
VTPAGDSTPRPGGTSISQVSDSGGAADVPSVRPRRPPLTPFSQVAGWLSGLDASTHAEGDPDLWITGISLSSQRIAPGDLYAALPGAFRHGIEFVPSARSAGAVAVLTDSAGAVELAGDPALATVPVIRVSNPRAVLGELAARIYGQPATQMRTIGVTGTQGKTTTTRLAEAALSAAGVRSAAVGTIGTRIAGVDVPTALTTPEAPDLHGLFAVMHERRVAACAMEVSSHALRLGRVDGVRFDVAVFCNLGRDHLDFHSSMEDYYQAKASLFTSERAKQALVNIDDEHGRRLARETRLPVQTISTRGGSADWTVSGVELGPLGSGFWLHGPMGGLRIWVECPLPGEVNIANAVAAVAASVLVGFDAELVARGLSQVAGVPGRFERVDAGQDFAVIVDYAHKPDAVEAALRTLRPLTRGRLLIVLGAGGDRDPGKRRLMGRAAAALADVLVVTDDNPRSEDPAEIRRALLHGAKERDGAVVMEVDDRREAIRAAIAMAKSGDIVLIAGKGHETGQDIAGTVHPFDDRDEARVALQMLASGGA